MIQWLQDKLIPKYKLSKAEELIITIIKNLLEQEDTEIKMAPISGRYYIVNKRLEYWVKVNEHAISVTNHKFNYTNVSAVQFRDMVIKMIESAMETDRTEFEAAVFKNEIELLEAIVKNIKEKK
jgi:hypothetical protein